MISKCSPKIVEKLLQLGVSIPATVTYRNKYMNRILVRIGKWSPEEDNSRLSHWSYHTTKIVWKTYSLNKGGWTCVISHVKAAFQSLYDISFTWSWSRLKKSTAAMCHVMHVQPLLPPRYPPSLTRQSCDPVPLTCDLLAQLSLHFLLCEDALLQHLQQIFLVLWHKVVTLWGSKTGDTYGSVSCTYRGWSSYFWKGGVPVLVVTT